MSHHLDSPLARQDARLNITDQYVFDTEDASALVMNVRTSLAGADRPMGFHDQGRYEFKVHLDDAELEDLTFRIKFDIETERGQSFTVSRLEGGDARRDAVIGGEIAHGDTDEVVDGVGGIRVWARRVADPFYLDLSLLEEVDAAVQHGQEAALTGHLPGSTSSSFDGSTVNSIVLQVPHSDGLLFPGRRIRLWSITKLATDAGGWRQINRAGLPMIWPIFRDAGSDLASRSNETHPIHDAENYGATLRDLIAGVVRRRGTAARPDAYAAVVTQRLTPDTLPYRIGTPAVFGFAGFNGRQLSDNAPEVMFSLVTNSAVPTGLSAAVSASTLTDTFPFVAAAAAAVSA